MSERRLIDAVGSERERYMREMSKSERVRVRGIQEMYTRGRALME